MTSDAGDDLMFSPPLNDSTLLARMGQSAKSINLNDWSISNMGRSLEAIYEAAIERAKR